MRPHYSRVKDRHIFRSIIAYEREPSNAYSDAAIAVKIIGHVPERLARTLTLMLKDGRLRRIDGCITGPEQPVPEGVWRMGGLRC